MSNSAAAAAVRNLHLAGTAAAEAVDKVGIVVVAAAAAAAAAAGTATTVALIDQRLGYTAHLADYLADIVMTCSFTNNS